MQTQPQHLASIPQTPSHLRAHYAEQVAAMHLSSYGLVSATSSNQNNQPYDLVLDYHGRLFKVQVKSKMPYAEQSDGVEFKTRTSSGKHYYNDLDIDLYFILATDPVLGERYWILPSYLTSNNHTKVKIMYDDHYCYSGFLKKGLLQEALSDCIANKRNRNDLAFYFSALARRKD